MRSVRLAYQAADDIEASTPAELLGDFQRLDLVPALDRLAQADDIAEVAAVHGPGWRYTTAGVTVAGFHLFVALDDDDPRPRALLVYAADIWVTEFPDDEPT